MKFLLSLAVAATLITASTSPSAAAEPVPNASTVMAVQVSPQVPEAPSKAPLGFHLLSLAGLAALSTRRVPLSGAYLFGGITYGPSTEGELENGGTEVPDDFPEIDEKTGAVIHEDLVARRNMAISNRVNLGASAGPGNPAVGPGTGKSVSGKTAEDLEELDVATLRKMAEKAGIEVERAEGEGSPLKADYVRELSKTATPS